MMKQGQCPACEQHVEWQSVPSAAGLLYKCSNCWYHLDASGIAKLDKLTSDLKALELQRAKLLEAAR